MCKANEKSEMRFCKDIGMFTLDRSRLTCKFRTAFCNENCFNNKLYAYYTDMFKKDKRNDVYWQQLTGKQLNIELNRKQKQTDRVRFMSRGEAINNMADIDKIVDICKSNKNRLFWLPTRAWRNENMRKAIEQKLFKIKNLRVLASLDPSNKNEINKVNQCLINGWSTMFFGNDQKPFIEKSYKCPKTWEKIDGACVKCKAGCFNKSQVHVWLKMH